MYPKYDLMNSERKIPSDLPKTVVDTIKRIENNQFVLGVLFFRQDLVEMCTVPLNMIQPLSVELPTLTSLVKTALGEIVKTTKGMKIISNLLKDSKDEWLVKTTASINNVNPVVDRIMEDESVEGVIMTNKEGAPILTNINLTTASNYGAAMRRLGFLTHICVTEVDALDEVLILRVKTKKLELMVAPHQEFDIIVVQHARHKLKAKKD